MEQSNDVVSKINRKDKKIDFIKEARTNQICNLKIRMDSFFTINCAKCNH